MLGRRGPWPGRRSPPCRTSAVARRASDRRRGACTRRWRTSAAGAVGTADELDRRAGDGRERRRHVALAVQAARGVEGEADRGSCGRAVHDRECVRRQRQAVRGRAQHRVQRLPQVLRGGELRRGRGGGRVEQPRGDEPVGEPLRRRQVLDAGGRPLGDGADEIEGGVVCEQHVTSLTGDAGVASNERMASPVEQVTVWWRYAFAATVARTADAGAAVGVVLLAAGGAGGVRLGGLLAAALPPRTCSGRRIGRLVDRARDPRRPLAAGCVGYAAALAAATGALRLGLPVIGGGALVVAGACGPLLTGGFSSLTGGLGGCPERARGIDTLTYGVSGVVGPAAVAGLAALTSPAASLLTLAGATLVAALGTRWLPPVRVPAAAPVPGAGSGRRGARRGCRRPRCRSLRTDSRRRERARRADALGVEPLAPHVRRRTRGAAHRAALAAGHGHHGRERRGRRDARGARRGARRRGHRSSRRRRVAARGDGAGQPRRLRGTGRAAADRRARPGDPRPHRRTRRRLPARRAGLRGTRCCSGRSRWWAC